LTRVFNLPCLFFGQGIDAASSTSETADYTAFSVVLESHGKFFVLRAERGRWDYEALLERALHWYRLMKSKTGLPISFLVEAASAGLPLYQSLQKIAIQTGEFRCFCYRPKEDKETRAASAVVAMSEGRVFVQDVPGQNDWVDAYIAEFLAFPKGRFDDQVDSLSQLIRYRLRLIHRDERPSIN
jgi:predicted phage terminase large subunit-like protein